MTDPQEASASFDLAPAIRAAKAAEAICAFYREDPIVASFAAAFQSGRHPWGSTLDHAGRLVVMPPDRDCAHVIQPDGDGYAAVTFADPLAAHDPETEVNRTVMGIAWVVAKGATPREAFEGLCRVLELDDDLGLESNPQAGLR